MKKNKKTIILFILISACMCYCITSFARYSSSSIWNYYLTSHEFYFSSDNLGDSQKNVNTLWDGNSVHFNIKNNISQNLITTNDIRYEATCEVINEDATCTLNGTNSNEITGVLSNKSKCVNYIDENDVSNYNKTECEINGYEWQNLQANQDMYFDIIPKEENELTNVEVKITVNSTSPYKKSLTGIYELYKNKKDEGTIIKQYNIYKNYDELIITNSYDINKCVKIKFDCSKRIVDLEDEMTGYETDELGYVKEFKISIESMKNKKITFYNKTPNNNNDDLIVEESSGC